MTRIVSFLSIWICSILLASDAFAGCSVHDHNCTFHGVGRAVNHTVNQNNPTAVYIVSEGSNDIDFDNNVLLPDGAGPYVVSTSGFPPRADQPYQASSERPRTVYPTQFQIDFQQNTAQARHSGDLNGLGNIPGATGCTISGVGKACEEIVIQGNIPDPGTPEGFVVRQTNYLYNVFNVPNPSVAVRSYAVATGRAYFKDGTHLAYDLGNADFNVQITDPQTATLNGTGATSPEYVYNIGYNDFDAHAAGEVTFRNQLWRDPTPRVYRTQYGHANDHLIADAVQRRSKTYDYTIGFTDIDPLTGQRNAFKTYDNVRQSFHTSYINIRTDPSHLAKMQAEAERAKLANTPPANMVATTSARNLYDSTFINEALFSASGGLPSSIQRPTIVGNFQSNADESFAELGAELMGSCLDGDKLSCAGAGVVAFGEATSKFSNFFVLDPLNSGESCARYNGAGDCISTLVEVTPTKFYVKGAKLAGKYGLDTSDALKTTNKPIWSNTPKKTSVENAYGHWRKHKSEFPEFHNAKEYVDGTRDFLNNSPAGTLTRKRANTGVTIKYNPSTNTYATMTSDGVPKTMFKPEPKSATNKDGYNPNKFTSPMDYFLNGK